MDSNKLTSIDYKAPLNKSDDYRTSSYVGHRYIPDHDNSCKISDAPKPVDKILNRKEMTYDYTTEQRRAFRNTFLDNTSKRTPMLHANKIHLIKSYDECFLKNPPKPLKEYETIYKKEYVPKVVEKVESARNCVRFPKVQRCKDFVNPALPGSTKYLDMMATTNMLTYFHHNSESGSGISNNDAITLWKWLKTNPQNTVSTEAENLYQQRRQDVSKLKELHTRVKFVPNRGLTSESRSNYSQPKEDIKFYIEPIKPSTIFTSGSDVVRFTTESEMYGSKQRIQKYIDTGEARKI